MTDLPADVIELTSEPDDVTALLAAMRAAYQTTLTQGAAARRQFDADARAMAEKAAKAADQLRPDPRTVSVFAKQWSAYGDPTARARSVDSAPPASLAESAALWASIVRQCNATLERYSVSHREWQRAQSRLFHKREPEPRLPHGFLRNLTTLRTVCDAYPSLRDAYVREASASATRELRAALDASTAEQMQRLTEQLDSTLASILMGIEALEPAGSSWEHRLAGPLALATDFGAATRLGTIGSGLPRPYDVQVPCVLDFPTIRGLAIEASMQTRAAGLALLRSVVLRVLTNVPPGDVELTFIDPTAIGQTFADFLHLADYDERLVAAGVTTSAAAIERCLAEQVAHLETVIAKHLRGQFSTIHDYNRHAGEMTQPCRLLVIADYPSQFSERATEQLLSLVENGPRCGVYTVMLYTTEAAPPGSVSHERLTQSMDLVTLSGTSARLRLASGGQTVDFAPDACPPVAFDVDGRASTGAASWLDAIGNAAKRDADPVVTLDTFLPAFNRNRTGALPDLTPGAPPLTSSPDTWWNAWTTEQAVAPVGRSGAQGVASLFFSSTTVAGGAIVVGLPRSGKTTALHAMILTMAMLYPPEELELFLIDAKYGVEFKVYEHLPHARMISVHSEREFSLAALESVRQTIRERADLIKAQGSGVSNITEYRRATGESLPRIVVVIDEFHELFEEADTVGMAAFAAFSDIVRMGAFSGVHLVVASQTLSSMPAMDRQTLTLLPQRVAFMCNDYDAEIVMGDTNPGPSMLSKTGQGLFHPLRGDDPSKNQIFQGLYVPPDQRRAMLDALRAKADAVGWTRQPRVFDGNATATRLPSSPTQPTSSRFTVPIGEPFTLESTHSLVLPRARGANVLLVGDRAEDRRTDPALRTVLHSVLLAGQAQHAAVTVVDLSGDVEAGSALTVMDVADSTGARYVRSAQLEAVLREHAAIAAQRTAAGRYRDPTALLVIHGLQKARQLTPLDPYARSEDASLPLGPSALLAAVAVSGPEVGVHVVLDVDRLRAVEERLGPELLGEFLLRVAGSATDHRDLPQVAADDGQVAALRDGQLLVGDFSAGTSTRVRGYGPLATPPGTTEVPDV